MGGTQLKPQALKFSNEMKIQDLQLKFTDGWFRHFKGHHGLQYKKARGDAKSDPQKKEKIVFIQSRPIKVRIFY